MAIPKVRGRRLRRVLEVAFLGLTLAACSADDELTDPVTSEEHAVLAQGALDPGFGGSGLVWQTETAATNMGALTYGGNGAVFYSAVDRSRPFGPWHALYGRISSDGTRTQGWNGGHERPLDGASGGAPGGAVFLPIESATVVAHTNGHAGQLTKLNSSGDIVYQTTVQPTGYVDVQLSNIVSNSTSLAVVAGIGWKGDGLTKPFLLVGRINLNNGTLDPSWNGGKFVERALGEGSRWVAGLAGFVSSDRTTVAVGGLDQVLRLTSTGAFDGGFGQVSVPGVTDVAETKRGLVVAMTSGGKLFGFASNGTFAPGWSTSGFDTRSYSGETTSSLFYDAQVDRLFVGGSADPFGNGDSYGTLVSVRPDAVFDRTFANGNAKVTTLFDSSIGAAYTRLRTLGGYDTHVFAGFDLIYLGAKTTGLARYKVPTMGDGQPCASFNGCASGLSCRTHCRSGSAISCYDVCE